MKKESRHGTGNAQTRPGRNDRSVPRWEGPEETRPRGYLPAIDNPENDRDAAGENLNDPDRNKLKDWSRTKGEMMANKTQTPVEKIHEDAKGQFAKPMKHSDNNGVASAKPRVITGSDDATAHKTPPGQKPVDKEWDLNYDERAVDADG